MKTTKRYRERRPSTKSNADPMGGEGWRTHYAIESPSRANTRNLRRKKFR